MMPPLAHSQPRPSTQPSSTPADQTAPTSIKSAAKKPAVKKGPTKGLAKKAPAKKAPAKKALTKKARAKRLRQRVGRMVRYRTTVRGHRVLPSSTRIEGAKLRALMVTSISDHLATLPGASGVRRAANIAEPVLRGLGGERVVTDVGGVNLYGACPSKMDPPATYFGPQQITSVEIVSGIPSLAAGPNAMGGRVDISLFYERDRRRSAEIHGFSGLRYDSARSGFAVSGGTFGGNDTFDLRAAGEFFKLDNYTAPSDVEIPAKHAHVSVSLAAGANLGSRHRIDQAIFYSRENDVLFPALPMDNEEAELVLYNARHRYRPASGLFRELTLRGGYAQINHVMSNRLKSNRKMVRAETPSETRSLAISFAADWRLRTTTQLVTGVDFRLSTRDATRTRQMVSSGMTFKDHIWPDTRQMIAGGFAELSLRMGSRSRLRLGVRGDMVLSVADAVDDPSLQKKTIREQYVKRYGSEAADVNRQEGLVAATTLLTMRPWWRWLRLHIGGAMTMRAAGLTERYFAFGPAPGGFQVGNPTLSAEKRLMGELGTKVQLKKLELRLTGHANFVSDYILQKELDRLDVNGDGTPDSVRGFDNIDAALFGFEAAISYRPIRGLRLRADVGYVFAKDTILGRPLPEIPPLAGSFAVRYGFGDKFLGLYLEAGGNFAAPQRRVDRRFPEDTTDGWATFRLEAGLMVSPFKVRVQVENLFDAEYNEHLTREVMLAYDGLPAGSEVLAMGRRVLLSLYGEL
jgi:iron complex outermembrane receptor protein